MDRRSFLSAGLTPVAALRAELAPRLRSAARAPESAYDLDRGLVYLNHASIGTVPRVVRAAHARYLELCERNPWRYVWGEEWAELFDATHARAARTLGCEEADVAITGNTTQAFGLVANGLEVVDGTRDEVLFPSWNHVGASASWEAAAGPRGYRVRRFDFPEEDVPGLAADDVVALFEAAITERTAVLVLPHVDNVRGLRHPVARIARTARALGVRWVCVDAAQSVGMFAVDAPALEADLVATSAHKWLQAPKGTGLAYVSPAMREHLRPLVETWGAARWAGSARAYTDFGARALPALLATDDALRFHEEVGDRQKHHRALFEHARARADAAPELTWQSPRRFEDGAALFAIGLERGSADEVFDTLYDEHGFVLRPFATGGRNHLRVSPNVANTKAELDHLFDRLAEILSR